MTATDFQPATPEATVRALHDAFHRRDFQTGARFFAPTFSNHG